jgi:hypothetical protein
LEVAAGPFGNVKRVGVRRIFVHAAVWHAASNSANRPPVSGHARLDCMG